MNQVPNAPMECTESGELSEEVDTIFAQNSMGDEAEDTDANEDEDGHDLQGVFVTKEQYLRDLSDADYDV